MKLLPALLAIPACTARVISSAPEQVALHAKVDHSSLAKVIDESPLLSFHRSLVSIPSVSNDEGSVGEYVARFLEHHNFTVVRQLVNGLAEQDRKRFNVYAYIGDDDLPDSIVTSHIDTVPPFLPYRLSYDLDSGAFDRSHVRINGRGELLSSAQ